MEIEEQRDTLKIKNIDLLTVDICNNKSKHSPLLPNSLRLIITGPSNCGKTNVLFNLLTSPNGLKFKHVYIFSKSLHQPKYQLLNRILCQVPEVNYHQYTSNDEILHPNESEPYSIFIFDDVMCEKQGNMMSYFAMGRHNMVDAIYIGQTYSKISKMLLRDNSNMIAVFKQDETNLKHIYNDFVGSDMTFKKFKELCGLGWVNKYGFIVIDKEREMLDGRYRFGFDRFVRKI